jgi:hypothetical protein
MAPRHACRLANSDKSHIAAQASALTLFVHLFALPDHARFKAWPSRCHFNRQASGFSCRKSHLETPHPEAIRARRGDALERQDALRLSAIGSDLMLARHLGKPLFQLVQQNVQGTWQMARIVFVVSSHVEQHDAAIV